MIGKKEWLYKQTEQEKAITAKAKKVYKYE